MHTLYTIMRQNLKKFLNHKPHPQFTSYMLWTMKETPTTTLTLNLTLIAIYKQKRKKILLSYCERHNVLLWWAQKS